METIVIRDDFNEDIIDMTIMVTRLCNYNCVYCIENIPYDKSNNIVFIDLEKVIEFIHKTLEYFKTKTINIRIYGGEPTLHTGLYDFCQRLNSISRINIIEIFTNFSLDVQAAIDYLKIDKVSMFTSYHTNKMMSGKQYLNKVLACNDYHDKLTCNIMFENDYDEEALKLYKLFQKTWNSGIYKKTKTELIPIFSTAYAKSEYQKQSIQKMLAINKLFNEKLPFTIYDSERNVSKDYKVVGVNSLNFYNWKCSSGVNSIFIDQYGDVYPCGGVYTKRNVYYKNIVVKNIFRDKLEDIYVSVICQSPDCVLCVPLKVENVNKSKVSIYNIKEKFTINV